MKTYKHLFDKYISDDNISLSISTAMRGDKAKKTKKKLLDMYNHLDIWIPKLKKIAANFYNHKHTPKEIYDGISRKKRTILVPTVIELVIQHMQVNVLKSIFMKSFYDHSYAAIPGRGALLGKKRILKWKRRDPDNMKYYLKLDIRHFFESVNTTVLKNLLAKHIQDKVFLKHLFTVIDVNDNGLPLGFYTSQWYANWYLTEFDHYVKEKLGAKFYIRYMDDMVIFDEDKTRLHQIFNGIKDYLKNTLDLDLKGNYRVSPLTDKIFLDFMGFRFYSNRTTLRKSIMLKSIRKAKILAKKRKSTPLTVYDARQMLSYLGWLKYTDTYYRYLRDIKPSILFNSLKKIVSRFDRGEVKSMWYSSESNIKPLLEDTSSSRYYNYARRNIKEISTTDENGNVLITYKYNEVKIPKDQWFIFKQQQTLQADVDYISMMSEV